MIRQLRKRFITTAMTAVVLVMAFIVIVMNTVNYLNTTRETSLVMEILTANEGEFPEELNPWDDDFDPGKHVYPGKPGERDPEEWRRLSPEAPYQSRYFSVWFEEDGSVETKMNRIAAITSEEASAMAKKLLDQGKTSGYTGDYRYARMTEDEDVGYVFLDCRIQLNSLKSFFITSLAVFAAALLGIYFLVVVFSKRALAPVEQSYAKQKQFITNAGHELKTPLAVIRSCTDVAEMELGENKWLSGIREQTERMASLTNDLVALARMDEQADSLEKTDTDMTALVKDVWEPFEVLAEKEGHTLKLQIEENVRAKVHTPSIRQLCSILADNAVKYTRKGGEITLALSSKGKTIRISSENPAEGFDKGDQDVLFDRFYRKDADRNSATGGSGIGLSLARSITEAHGGTIKAHSDGEILRIEANI